MCDSRMRTLLQDIKYTLRSWRSFPGLCSVAFLALALGIGANTTIFSAVDAVLVRPLGFRDADRIVHVFERSPKAGVEHYFASLADYHDWRDRSRTLDHFACFWRNEMNVTQAGGDPERVRGVSVSRGFIDTLGIKLLLGRDISVEENTPPNPPRVALITAELWRRRFAADPNVIGKSIDVNRDPTTIIGVLPSGIRFADDAQIWNNLAPYRSRPGPRFAEVIARLRTGVTLAQAQQEMTQVAAALSREFPATNKDWTVALKTEPDELLGNVRPALVMVFMSVGLLLLIACANVANLLLAQAAARQREIAIRAALGASAARLARQFLTESLLLATCGGAAGVLLAVWGVHLVRSLDLRDVPRLDQVSMNPQVLLYSLALTLITGVLFGLAPVWRAVRPELASAIKQDDKGSSQQRARNALVIAQVAIAVVLVSSAGLLIKSFGHLVSMNPGFETENILTANIPLPYSQYHEPAPISNFFDRLLDSVVTLPGVKAVGVTTSLPLEQDLDYRLPFHFRSIPAPHNPNDQTAFHRMVSPDLFRALGTPLVAGRFFTSQDAASAPGVVIINQALARQYWPKGSPLGQKISAIVGGFGPLGRILLKDPEVVGVIADVKYTGLAAEPAPAIYFPMRQAPFNSQTLVVRTAGSPRALLGAIRQRVHALDPNLPVAHVNTMSEQVAGSVAQPRFQAILLGAFAGLALLLGALGIYGVLSYAVVRRTREIGIRMALGGQPADIRRMILGQGLRLVSTGILIGLGLAFLAARIFESLLFGVRATDAGTYAMVVFVLISVSIAASYVPARRATRIDPSRSLRNS
jgi:putative ABC transport system permease protein